MDEQIQPTADYIAAASSLMTSDQPVTNIEENPFEEKNLAIHLIIQRKPLTTRRFPSRP
jgi:hypothetical protein